MIKVSVTKSDSLATVDCQVVVFQDGKVREYLQPTLDTGEVREFWIKPGQMFFVKQLPSQVPTPTH